MDSYTILTLLYPTLKLNQVAFHQDHCHPYAGFSSTELKLMGLVDEKISEWQHKRNLIPNLQLLEGRENECKNKTPLKKWLEEDPRHTIAYMPADVSVELKDFESFFEGRRKLIKAELMRVFHV